MRSVSKVCPRVSKSFSVMSVSKMYLRMYQSRRVSKVYPYISKSVSVMECI